MGRSRVRGFRRALWRISVLLLVAAASAAVLARALVLHRTLATGNSDVVNAAAHQVDARLSSSLERYDALGTLLAQELGSGELGTASFRAAMAGAHLGAHYPGVLGAGFIQYVAPSAVPGFLAAERPGGQPAFAIQPSGTRPFYCVGASAYWTTAAVGHPPLVGFDLCSISTIRQALLDSARTGRAAVVPGKEIGKELDGDFVLVVPYLAGNPQTAAARRSDVVGWSAVLVDATTMIAARQMSATPSTDVALYAGSRAEPSDLVASSAPADEPTVGRSTDTIATGTTWAIRTSVLTTYPGISQPWLTPLVLLIGGLLLVGALAGLLWLLARSRRRAEERAAESDRAMRQSEARFESIAGASPVGIVETNADLEITYLNSQLEAIADRPADEILGTNWMLLLHPDDRERFVEEASEAIAQRRELSSSARVVRPSGEVRTVRVRTAALAAGSASVLERYVATIEDVSEELALEGQLRHQALHDHLTGLPNRALFLDRLEQAIERARRGGPGPAVLFLDLDRFKMVNDSLGHKAGDELLVQLADRLRASTRGGETVARLGGDEFAVLLPEVTGNGPAVAVATRILRALEAPFRLQGHEIVSSVSVGIMRARPGDDPGTVLLGADAAMYEAKRTGRAGYATFQEGLHEHSLEQLTIEGEIRQGMQQDQFEVFYQPVIDLRTGEVAGAEALLRWRHPERGLVPPGAFIPVAEESGLIVPLGHWAFGAAVDQLAEFDADPGGPRLPLLAINLSPHQLRNPRLARERQALVDRRGIDPRRICVELTETLVMDDSDATRAILDQMHERGIRIAIDDFGTGYSSLAYLQRLPVSTLKIDRRFVADLGTSPEADAIVAAIIEMAHHLGLIVVAEGVEEEVQRRTLLALGCDTAQGFLWAPAMPAGELSAWCRQHRAADHPTVAAGRC